MKVSNFDPKPISDIELAFPAHVVGTFLPNWEDIPDEFKRSSNIWQQVVTQWFYNGLNGNLIPKLGVDANKAIRHLSACMRSFEPKHEHKTAGVAYLLSQWFERYEP